MVVAATTKPLLPEVRLSQEASYPAGLPGSGRQVQREAVNSATGYTEHSSIGNMLYQSSLNKGGDFANQVISNIAQGNYGQVGSIKGSRRTESLLLPIWASIRAAVLPMIM